MPKTRLFRFLKSITFYCLIVLFITLSTISISIPLAKYVVPGDLMPVDNQTAITIDNINIIPMVTGGILPNRQLVIRDGIIRAINPAGTVAGKSSRLIDGKGAFVTPGLFDMHVHLYDAKYLMLNLAYGVTSVRAMGGTPEALRWKKSLSNNEWLASNLYLSSAIFDGEQTHILNQSVTSEQQGRQLVRRAKAEGYDLVKAYGYLEKEVFEAIVDEARKIAMPVAKHAPHPVKGSDWSWIEGLQSLEHVEDIFQGPLEYKFDHEKLEQTAKKLYSLKVPVVPTLTTFDHLTQLSNQKQDFIDTLPLEYLNPMYREIIRRYSVNRWLADSQTQSQFHSRERYFLFEIVKVLNKHEVKLLVGSDAGTMYTISGESTHREMALLNQAGLSTDEVLKAATIYAAETLDVESRYGSIEIGKVADLVLATGNPLDDLSHLKSPFAVVKNGQWLSQPTLLELKASAMNTTGYYWSFIRMLEGVLVRL